MARPTCSGCYGFGPCIDPALHGRPLGLCHPDDRKALELSCPEYYWQNDPFAARGWAYDDKGELVARIARSA